MDHSKEYIKMCEKAEEIQKGWRPKEGDTLWVEKNDYHTNLIKYINKEEAIDVLKIILGVKRSWLDKHIFLPRQDQLQEMIKEDWQLSLTEFCKWILGKNNTIFYTHRGEFNSMEQLWLAFVMKEKYNKIWDGKEWVVE